MSVAQTNKLWLRILEPRRKHLLHAICDCADDDGRAFPSVNYLVWKTDIPRSTVIQYMQEFRDTGVLEDIGRRSDIEPLIEKFSEKDTSVVFVNLDKLETKKPWRKKGEGSPVAGLPWSSGRQGVVQPRAGGSPVDGCAIRKNHQEPSLEPSGEAPADFHPLQYAGKFIEEIQSVPYELQKSTSIIRCIGLSLEALVNGGKSIGAAYEFLMAVTLDGIERHEPIDKFWFEDSKWRNVNGKQPGQTSAAAGRAERSAASLAHVLRKRIDQRTSSNPTQR